MSKGTALHDRAPGTPRLQRRHPGTPISAPKKSSSSRSCPRCISKPLPHNLLRTARRAATPLVGILTLLQIAACSGPTARHTAPASPGPIQVSGDWDDVRPAVTAALGKTELVLVTLDTPEPDRLEYTLRSSRDEPATLTIQRLDPEGAPDPVRITMACSVGRFGDPSREGEFLALIADRLEQLKGVEVAPIRD